MPETSFILIVDRDAEQAEALTEQLRDEGHACRLVATGQEALESVSARQPDVIVTDASLVGSDGNDWLHLVRRQLPDAEIIFLTPGDEDARLRTLTHELSVFKSMPLELASREIQKVVGAAAERAKSSRQQRVLREQADRRIEFEGIITGNAQMKRIIHMVRRVADSKLTVLILGESGTGKELIAQAIHRHSRRSDKPYRAINCAGLNDNLLESELFGHVKGAFTGAVADRKGLFEVADGGTLFLDEVGDMPLIMQAKLLRTLENGEITPVGSNEIRKVDVRMVAATRRDLRGMIESADFRDDLYYRLHQATIRLPSLKERRDDIPLLIDYFLKEADKTHGKQVASIAPEAVRRLTSHQWPGNIRELRSVVDAMVVMAEGDQLGVEDLPENIRSSSEIVLASGPTTAGLTMEQMERVHIANTLKLTGGNREKTAKMLGIGARTLYRKLREYDLQ